MIREQSRKPTYIISINGDVVALKSRLISLTLSDKSGFEADELTLQIDDHDGKVAIPKKGVKITAEFGFEGELQNKGDYIVDECEHQGPPDTLTIHAHSANFRETLLEHREQSYHDTTLGEILQQIAKRNGLELSASDKYKNIKIKHADQNNESDANFMTRLGKNNGAIGTIKSNHLLFIERGACKTASGEDIPTATIHRNDGDAHTYREIDRNEQVTGVRAYYHDPSKGKREKTEVKHKRKRKRRKKKVTYKTAAEKAAAEKAKKEKEKRQQRTKVEVGKKGSYRSLKRTFATKEAAEKAAEAELKSLKMRGKSLSLNLAYGRADLFAEQPLKAVGYKDAIDSVDWFIDTVTHSLSDSGYVCDLSCEIKT